MRVNCLRLGSVPSLNNLVVIFVLVVSGHAATSESNQDDEEKERFHEFTMLRNSDFDRHSKTLNPFNSASNAHAS